MKMKSPHQALHNMCLMAEGEDDSSSVSSCASLNAENYSQLLQTFKETHEEAN